MANFTITLNYLIEDDADGNPQVHMTNASIGAATSESISETNSTSITANGDINLAPDDTADLWFRLNNDDNWGVAAVELLDEDRSVWGGSADNYALDADEQLDYPNVDPQTGREPALPTSPNSVGIRDTNVKHKTVNYRVEFHNSVTNTTIYSDPRIRDGGGGGTN